MFDRVKFREVLASYKSDFVSKTWKNERYKWKAVKCFQDNWDINAEDFNAMFKKATSKVDNLLASMNNYPKQMIQNFADVAAEDVRGMFIELFDESKDVYERIVAFRQKSNELLARFGNGAKSHYQTANAITTYLWLRYPDKYYIYKHTEIIKSADLLQCDYKFIGVSSGEKIRNFIAFYDEICEEFQRDDELKEILASLTTPEYYPDPELRTLTMDFGFYISRYYKPEQAATPDDETKPDKENPASGLHEANGGTDDADINYWFLNANPKIWSMASMPVGAAQAYTLYNDNGNKRRIFQNFLEAKAGDMVIGYESTPRKQIVAILRVNAGQDGEKIYFEKLEGLAMPIDYATLKANPELEDMEYFANPQGSLFKLTEDEYSAINDMIRDENPTGEAKKKNSYGKEDFLSEVFMTEDKYDRLKAVLLKKKNIILQGAPGVGKTYTAKRLAYSIMEEKDDDRIEFVQFHQNYSYEDFMMGYKPADEGFELKYGIFYRFCQKAANHPDKDYFFIIDEINRGNMSKIFGELLMLIEADYRNKEITLAYNGLPFSVPENLHIIGMMNTADRSLAMIDYALRRRFSFFEMDPAFETAGFSDYQKRLGNDTFNTLIERVIELNREITADKSLGKGFRIGHSYFSNWEECAEERMKDVVDFDVLPMLEEYWFDDAGKLQKWENILHGIFQ